jgi:hypothetical protein
MQFLQLALKWLRAKQAATAARCPVYTIRLPRYMPLATRSLTWSPIFLTSQPDTVLIVGSDNLGFY